MVVDGVVAEPVRRGRVGGVLGVASVGLLAAAVAWAHHWNVVTISIVAGWGLATVLAFVVSMWSLRTSRAARGLARLGVSLAAVSLLALALAGVLFAAGINTAGACGGG